MCAVITLFYLGMYKLPCYSNFDATAALCIGTRTENFGLHISKIALNYAIYLHC